MPQVNASAEHPLRLWRHVHGLTLGQLADGVARRGHSVTEQHLSDIELGDRWPGALLAQALQGVTGLPLELLITYGRPRRR
jgi:transcriptional regulator with XRE-family HTH domain